MPDMFLLFSFLSLEESTFETRKNVFCFFSKALFILEIFKFSLCSITKENLLSKKKKKKKYGLETHSRPFVFMKKTAQPLLENEIFEAS